jgi:hypothetical protein
MQQEGISKISHCISCYHRMNLWCYCKSLVSVRFSKKLGAGGGELHIGPAVLRRLDRIGDLD